MLLQTKQFHPTYTHNPTLATHFYPPSLSFCPSSTPVRFATTPDTQLTRASHAKRPFVT